MTRRWLAVAAVVLATAAAAIESDPLPVPEEGARRKAVLVYNEGVKLLLEKRFAEAQARFEAAIAAHEAFAEAHNNLAFSLRMQSAGNAERALRHYARALEINPGLAQAYMYRGALFTQLGDLARARADLESLRPLNPNLAVRLEKVMADRVDSKDRDGIAAQVDVY
jgi:tetratricopeptide (TPR) repeat protein